MAIEIVDLAIKNGGSFHSYVSLPEDPEGILGCKPNAMKLRGMLVTTYFWG